MKAKNGLTIRIGAPFTLLTVWLLFFASFLVFTTAVPARAAESAQAPESSDGGCEPPKGWDQTTRLFHSKVSQKEWTIQVDEPEMEVILELFYFQDRSKEGCSYDCATGECQVDEIGEWVSPLGKAAVRDGKKGADGGSIRQKGRLAQGSYKAVFRVTGKGSINVGLRVRKQPAPATSTPHPSFTPPPPAVTAQPTAGQPTIESTETRQTHTPTPGSITTAAPTQVIPTATEEPAPATRKPDQRKNAATKTPRPPNTLPPPMRSAGNSTPVLVPVTGAGQGGLIRQASRFPGGFLTMGAGLLGFALVFAGIWNRRKR